MNASVRYILFVILAMVAGLVLLDTDPKVAMIAKQENAKVVAPVTGTALSKEPVVLELFTSQGCSSCPPADRLATHLAKNPQLIVITRPVTYWDRLGWKDTLGKAANTNLQRSYARRGLGGRNGVYTPQVVVDGSSGVVGSKAQSINSLISEARRVAKPEIVTMKEGNRTLSVMVSGVSRSGATLSLVGLDRSETVSIGRGENTGRQITYTNVYKGERNIGEWRGGNAKFSVTPAARNIAGANHYALVLRDGKAGRILSAKLI